MSTTPTRSTMSRPDKNEDGSITIHFGGDPKAGQLPAHRAGLELHRQDVSAEEGGAGR